MQSNFYYDENNEKLGVEYINTDNSWWNFIQQSLPYIFFSFQIGIIYLMICIFIEVIEWIIFANSISWFPLQKMEYTIFVISFISFIRFIGYEVINHFDILLQKTREDQMFYMERIAYLEKENAEMKKIFRRMVAFSEAD
jgi:hypothetical protein